MRASEVTLVRPACRGWLRRTQHQCADRLAVVFLRNLFILFHQTGSEIHTDFKACNF